MTWLWMPNAVPSYTLKRRSDEPTFVVHPQPSLQTDLRLYGDHHYIPDTYFDDTPVWVYPAVPGRSDPSIMPVPVPAFYFGPTKAPAVPTSSAAPPESSYHTAPDAAWMRTCDLHCHYPIQPNQRGGVNPQIPATGAANRVAVEKTNSSLRPAKRARTGAYGESADGADVLERAKFTHVSVRGGTGGAGGGGGVRGGAGGTGAGPMFNFNFR
ncbi:hypothetical protein K438DRAFT_1957940 [Mycena galopus ATCC 62051]|nr:hypothetical protein K438DRAFT_1957940 [Mycena galopus ATCC 62051]